MTKEEIKNGNKIIALFDGWKISGNRFEKTFPKDEYGWESYTSIKDAEFEYHTNWNLLMPIVEKIEKIVARLNIENEYCCIMSEVENKIVFYKYCTAPTKIEATWRTVIEFLKWHTEKQNP